MFYRLFFLSSVLTLFVLSRSLFVWFAYFRRPFHTPTDTSLGPHPPLIPDSLPRPFFFASAPDVDTGTVVSSKRRFGIILPLSTLRALSQPCGFIQESCPFQPALAVIRGLFPRNPPESAPSLARVP